MVKTNKKIRWDSEGAVWKNLLWALCFSVFRPWEASVRLVYSVDVTVPTSSFIHPLLTSTLFPFFNAQIKPDGVQRGIVGNIISRFETKGYKLVAMKTKQATKELLEEHYKDLVEKVSVEHENCFEPT